jgi:hypothetical protein
VAGLSLVVSIVGGVALAFGLGVAAWRTGILLRWKRRRAVVVSYERKSAHRGSSYATLVVRFSTEDGEVVQGTDTMPWNRYHPEQEIVVLEDPDSTTGHVVVPEFLRFWMMTLIFVPFGAAFLYAALVYVPGLGS